MLTKEENERLTRVGPGTPMGELFRRYWIPALLAEEIPVPDSPPVKVRLLGEDLVAFRDTGGRVGLLGGHCEHRRAPLWFGRNEASGLRCVYHGWKYDIEGNILETPAEPAESLLRHDVKHPAYPCREANGVIFTYMGPREKIPLFPNYAWLTIPREHVRVGKFLNECNWLQAVEGDIDSAHGEYLHRGLGGGSHLGMSKLSFETETERWGIRCAAVRLTPDDMKYVRTNLFVMPCIGCPPTGPSIDGKLDGHNSVYQVPMDDHNQWRFDMAMTRSGPIAAEEDRDRSERARDRIGPDFRKIANKANNYLIDWELRHEMALGVQGFHTQDAVVTEGMGPIVDRTMEHLGVSDTEIALTRRFLLAALKDMEQGLDPPGLVYDPADNDFEDLYCIEARIPREAPWNARELATRRA